MPLNKYSLGISPEGDFLHLLYYRETIGGREVADYASLRLPVGEDETPFLREARKFLLKNRLGPTDSITLGVPRRNCIFRHINTPPVREKDLPELVGFESDRHLPGKREEFFVGYQYVERLKDGGHHLLLGAAQRAEPDRLLALLHKANLTPTRIQPEPVALAAAFNRFNTRSVPVLLLQLEGSAVGVDLLDGARIVLSRRMSLRGVIPVEERRSGEEESRETGNVEEKDPDLEGKVAEFIAHKLSQPIFLEGLPGKTLPEVWLTARMGGNKRLIDRLEYKLNVPIRIFSPSTHIPFPSEAPGETASAAILLGLAILGLPSGQGGLELLEERENGLGKRSNFRLTAALLIVFVGLLAAHAVGLDFRQRRYIESIDKDVQALKVEKESVEGISRSVRRKSDRLHFLSQTIQNRTRQSDLLRELTLLIPADSYLSEYVFKKGKVEITGLSPSASKLLPILEESLFFRGAEFAAPIVSQGKTLERFKIRLLLEKDSG